MLFRLIILGAVLFGAGCAGSTPPTAPATAPKADVKLPPEVELDAAAATAIHKKKSKP
jgi:hypothetical protein